MSTVEGAKGTNTILARFGYEYDYENRITKITKDNNDIAEFAYDAIGRRIKKVDSVAGTTNIYYYNDKWQVLVDYDSVQPRWFAYGNYIDETLMMGTNTSVFNLKLYVHDHLFSPVALVQRFHFLLQERYEYDAYGNCQILSPSYEPRATSDENNPYLFTGRRLDILDNGSLKLQYNRNRYYDQYTGRWLTHDPLGYVDGMNFYEYVRSNPAKGLDPWGNWTECSAKAKIWEQITEWRGEQYDFAADLFTWFHDKEGPTPYTPTSDNIDEVKEHGMPKILDKIFITVPGHPPETGIYPVSVAHSGGDASSNIRWWYWPSMDNKNMLYAYGGADLSFNGTVYVFRDDTLWGWSDWHWTGSVNVTLSDEYVFDKTGAGGEVKQFFSSASSAYRAAVWLEQNCAYKSFKHTMNFDLSWEWLGLPDIWYDMGAGQPLPPG